MTSVSSRSHGGLPKSKHLVNPFDSDEDEPATSSTTTRSGVSGSAGQKGYSNPFDDDAKSHVKPKSKSVHPAEDSTNPFDDEYSPPKPVKHVKNGNKIKDGGHSSQTISSHDAGNPFNDDYEVTSKPKSRGENILDNGSLFDDDDEDLSAAKPPRGRKSSSRGFAAKIKESGSRMKESASNTLSNVKLPALSSGSSSHNGEDKSTKKSKGKQNSRDLFGEPEAPTFNITQQSYFSQSDESRFASQTVEELQQYAVSKSKDTTSSIKNAIRIAEDTKGIATTTLEALHDQGTQIRRTHETAVHVDMELGRGEKLLGSLGGIFSMTWKPKKAHKISGPQVDPDQYHRKSHLGDRDALGLGGEAARARQRQLDGLNGAEAQLQIEKNVQDDALTDLSNVLDQLKGMTVEMGNEIERQNGDLDRMHDDVSELNNRVRGANARTRHLLSR